MNSLGNMVFLLPKWFLGRESRHAGALSDVMEQNNPVSQSQVLDDPSFAARIRMRDEASQSVHRGACKRTHGAVP